MEPLIDVYVEEGFVFLAMKLRPDAGVQDVEPVKVTYPSGAPMIPLRLTAVAANPNMAVMVWVYAEEQAAPANYAAATIADDELVFSLDGASNNYRILMGQKADEHAGQAFITEYAGPSAEVAVGHPLLRELQLQYPYVTRLNTVISPEEMTVDPVFRYDSDLPDVSNVRDLTDMRLECEGFSLAPAAAPVAFMARGAVAAESAGADDTGVSASAADAAPDATSSNESTIIVIVALAALAVMALVGLGAWVRERRGE